VSAAVGTGAVLGERPEHRQPHINARAETVAEKPSFRAAFKQRRCLVLTDGLYEWKAEGKHKQPHYFRLKSGEPFAFHRPLGALDQWRAPARNLYDPDDRGQRRPPAGPRPHAGHPSARRLRTVAQSE
jgi:hypothetical protein